MAAFIGGGMSPAEQSGVRSHLDHCAECRAIVVGAVKHVHAEPRFATPSRDDTLAVGSDAQQTIPRMSRQVLDAGVQVGPYAIERLLGSGGMGVVYAARDSRLDRTVALKLIRQHAGLGTEQLADRLRRESKALARLSHPNVTAVYELGSAGGEIFVAMEYVAGTTLRAWLDERRREPREILATFTLAGRGLAAAHAAGLVHRDFKPDNVLLGEGGVVKVTDFGLATIQDELAPLEVRMSMPAASTELTRTGAIVGTPAYMSPEQFGAAVIDARSDQFAFCVALYEALVGERPFTGNTVEAIAAAVLAGRTDMPRTARVSRRVRRALLRGLSTSPGARFASMDELLVALAPRRRSVMVGIAGVTVAGWAVVGAALLSSGSAAPATCSLAANEVATVWNPARKTAAARAFAATGTQDATAAWSAVERRLDGYLGDWAAMHTESCKATHVARVQSPAALDLRTACLERRKHEIDALVRVFEQADASVVANARQAVAALPDLAPCGDVEVLARRTPLPTDPLARRRHDAIRARIDEARALVDVSQYDRALPVLAGITATDDRAVTEFPALEAEALQLRAKLHTAAGQDADAEPLLHRALVQAQTVRADDLVAAVAVDLAFAIGHDRKRTVDANRWVDFATAAITAKGGDELLAARLDTVRANILLGEGEVARAEAFDRRAVATAAKLAPGSPLEAETLDALGTVLGMQGKLDEAVPTLARAVTLTEANYGASHSLTATVRMNYANTLTTTRRFDEARVQYEQALAIRTALFGEHSVQVAFILSNLGQMLQESGKHAEARKHLERALAIRTAELGADSPAVAKTAANLGYLLLDLEDYAGARTHFEQAGAILEAKLPPRHPMRADDLAGLGLAHIGLGDPTTAIAPLTRAAALGAEGDPVNHASIQAALALALHASKRDRPRAAKLAAAARAILVEAGETESVAEIDAWLPRR